MNAARSRAAVRLARRLSADTGRRVELDYGGARRDWWGGWHLRWTDGPTAVTMRALVSTYARHAQARGTEFLVGRVRYTRDWSETGRSVALLRFLQHHPGEWSWCTGLLDLAFDTTEYPDTMPHIWQRRAAALISYGAGTSVDRQAYEALAAHAGTGWAGAIDWLDMAENSICEIVTVAK